MSKRFHKDSQFGPGPRHALDREQRAVWRARVNFARRAGRITALQAEAALALLKRLGERGQCDPTHETIAKDAGCKRGTVITALARLRDCGLLTWVRRIVRSGWRCEQTSNAYVLVVSTGWSCESKVRTATRTDISSSALEGRQKALAAMIEASVDIGDLLAARRAAWAAQAAAR